MDTATDLKNFNIFYIYKTRYLWISGYIEIAQAMKMKILK